MRWLHFPAVLLTPLFLVSFNPPLMKPSDLTRRLQDSLAASPEALAASGCALPVSREPAPRAGSHCTYSDYAFNFK
jgi:hypothetical protein